MGFLYTIKGRESLKYAKLEAPQLEFSWQQSFVVVSYIHDGILFQMIKLLSVFELCIMPT